MAPIPSEETENLKGLSYNCQIAGTPPLGPPLMTRMADLYPPSERSRDRAYTLSPHSISMTGSVSAPLHHIMINMGGETHSDQTLITHPVSNLGQHL